MKYYFAPGTCSIGVRVVLEEIGKPYEAVKVDFANRAQYAAPYVEKNPKSKVPLLERDDGATLTEFAAINMWLALSNPDKRLIPADPDGHARMIEAMDYAVGTMHMQGWQRFWRPGNFVANEAEHAAVKARGLEILAKGFDIMDKTLRGKEWLVGDYSLADSALFYVTWWTTRNSKLELPANVKAHYAGMNARPAVQRALKGEGF